MAYGLKYTGQFDSLLVPAYTFEVNIYKNNYVGDPTDLIFARDPVVHEWPDDDPNPPIKGSTLTLQLVNDTSGAYNLQSFYSENDNEFYIDFILVSTGETLFTGFLMQDDCAELVTSAAHVIKLTFSDNLGVLKNVRLDEAAVKFGAATTETSVAFSAGVPKVINISNGVPLNPFNVQPGQTFTINGGGLAGTWTVVANLGALPLTGWAIQVVEDVPATGVYIDSYTYVTPVPLEGYIPLTTILRLCMLSTGLERTARVLTKLFPTGGTTGRLFEDTYVQATTFIKGNEWQSCYEVLESIMGRFGMSCFMAYSEWYFVRWGEFHEYFTGAGATYLGFNYDKDFVFLSNLTRVKNFSFLQDNECEMGMIQSILRPYRYAKETFNYNRSEDFIRNQALDQLGPLVNVQIVGAQTWYDYDFKYWTAWDGSPGPDAARYIRIIKESGQEVDRFAVITGNTFDNPRAAQSSDFYVPMGCVIKYSFDYKTDVSQPGTVTSLFAVRIRDNSTDRYLNNNGTWNNVPYTFSYQVLAGDDTNQWHTVEIKSNPIPFNSLANVFLGIETATATDETHYRNIKIEILFPADENGYVIGHTHTKSQSKEIKNISEKDIVMDTAPYPVFGGCLFLDTTTGIFQDPTTTWEYPSGLITFENLGALTTTETLYKRWRAMSKFNGTLLYIGLAEDIISNFSVFIRPGTILDDERYVPGSISINYRENRVDMTWWEIYHKYGPIPEIDHWVNFYEDNLYQFQYLYDKK